MLCCSHFIMHISGYTKFCWRIPSALKEVTGCKYWITDNCDMRTVRGATHLNVVMYNCLSKQVSFQQLWPWMNFLLRRIKSDKEYTLQCAPYAVSFSVGPPVISHTLRDDVPNGWPRARNTKKPSSLVVLSASRGSQFGLVYIEIKAEKWETAVYIWLFSVFPSTPRQEKSQGVMKNAGRNWTCQMWNGASVRFNLAFEKQTCWICPCGLYNSFSCNGTQAKNVEDTTIHVCM